MSKHWKPEEDVVQPLPKARRLKSLDEFSLPDFVGSPSTALRTGMDRIRRRHRLPDGAIAGLVLVAAACVGIAIGICAAFGPRVVVLEHVVRSAADTRS